MNFKINGILCNNRKRVYYIIIIFNVYVNWFGEVNLNS